MKNRLFACLTAAVTALLPGSVPAAADTEDYDYIGYFYMDDCPDPLYTGQEPDLSNAVLGLSVYADPDDQNLQVQPCRFTVGSGEFADSYTIDMTKVDFSTPGGYFLYVRSEPGVIECSTDLPLEKAQDGKIRVKLQSNRLSYYVVLRSNGSDLRFEPTDPRLAADAPIPIPLDLINRTDMKLIGTWESEISYTFSDPTVAELTMDYDAKYYRRLEINPLRLGETVLTATAADGRTCSCTVRVVEHLDYPAETTTNCTTVSDPIFETVWGDVNCSGGADIADAVLLARYLAEDPAVTVLPQGKRNAACFADADGNLDSDDLNIILQLFAGICKQTDLPVFPK